MSRKRLSIAIVIVLVSSILLGCSSEKLPIDIVAVMDNSVITEEQIKSEIVERDITIKIVEKLSVLELFSKDSNSSKDIQVEVLSKEQKRVIERMERFRKPLAENEAFNNLLREEVLYKVACNQGYKISPERALQIIKKDDKSTKEALEKNKKTLQDYNKMLLIQDEVVREYGFKSWSDYQKHRSNKIAQTMTIALIENEYRSIITEKIKNNINKDIDNAWEDYTEFLLKDKEIKVMNDKYYVNFYGEPWSYGEIVFDKTDTP